MIERLPDRLGERELLAADEIDRKVLQHDGEADRADQGREWAVLRVRPDRDEHREDAEQGARDRGAEQGAVDACPRIDDQEQADEGADHEDFAMREIEQVENAEDQRVADRHQRVGGAKHQAVDQLLVNHAGRGCPILREIIGIATPLQCAAAPKSCMTRDTATRALRVVAGVLRLRPTKRGIPAVTTAPMAAMSPCLIAASAVSCVPPSGASISTMSAVLPGASTPLSRP